MDVSIRRLGDWFDVSDWPSAPCPTCDAGRLLLPDDEFRNELRNNNMQHWSEWGEPSDVRAVFVARLRCSSQRCQEIVAFTGDFAVERHYDPGTDEYFRGTCKVRTMHPAVPLFAPPVNTPASVKAALLRAANTIWLDPLSAMTCLRTSLEALMTEHGVPTSETTRKGKTRRLSLHERIARFRNDQPDVSDLLEAVKWVGNDATHEGGQPITSTDALDMAEFVQVALDMIYVPDNSLILERARRIVIAQALVAPD